MTRPRSCTSRIVPRPGTVCASAASWLIPSSVATLAGRLAGGGAGAANVAAKGLGVAVTPAGSAAASGAGSAAGRLAADAGSAAARAPRPRTASPSVLILENKSPIRPKKTAPAPALRAHADLIAERVRSAPGSATQLEGPRGVDDPAEGPPERRLEGALFGGIGIGDGGEDHT